MKLKSRCFLTISLAALAGSSLVPAIQASHVYTSVCCSVPSSISVFDRTSHTLAQTMLAGQGATFITLTPDGTTAYVDNQSAESITVLDTATGATKATISLSALYGNPWNPGYAPNGSVLSPDGTMLYVEASCNDGGGVCVAAIDTATNAIAFNSFLAVGNGSLAPPAISKDGQTLYILFTSLILFDVTTQTVTANISYPDGGDISGFALSPDETYAIAITNIPAHSTPGTCGELVSCGVFALIDLTSQSVVTQVTYYSQYAGPVVFSPDSKFAYFVIDQSGQATVEVFAIASQQVVKTYPVGAASIKAIAITPEGGELELGNYNPTVLSMDTATGELTGSVTALGKVLTVTVSPDGALLYVPNYGSSVLEVIDPATQSITGQIPTGPSSAVEVSADGKRVVVAGCCVDSDGDIGLTVINTQTQQPIGSMILSSAFQSVVLAPNGHWAYAVLDARSAKTAQISVIDTASVTTVKAINLTAADTPGRAALSPDGGTLYVGDSYCPAGGTCVLQLLVVDLATATVATPIPLGIPSPVNTIDPTLGDIAISSDGSTAYVATTYGCTWYPCTQGQIEVVNLTQGTVGQIYPLPFGGANLALASNQILYVAACCAGYEGESYMYVIDLQGGAITSVPPSSSNGFIAGTLAANANGQLLYVCDIQPYSEGFGVSVFASVPSGAPTLYYSISLPSSCAGIGFSPI
jgi:YVTN family beta-propeller protein